jgi:divalent metal cation (Fe/Co/Zn/Cd) transporter
VQPIALWVAIATLAAKEGLFRYMLAVAERLRSPMLVANAWHARSDAASSLVVALGIAGSLMGYRFLDLLAAALVGFMIVRMGLKFAYEAMQELVDTGMSAEEVTAIRATLMTTPGVMGVHELRTRRMGHQGLVDAHVRVDARISVSEGHRIAEDARVKVIAENEHVLDVLVHVDVEDDVIKPADAEDLPEREELMRRLGEILGPDTPQVDKALLHYLAHRVEADVFLPAPFCLNGDRVVALEQRIASALRSDPHFTAISINCRVAPK